MPHGVKLSVFRIFRVLILPHLDSIPKFALQFSPKAEKCGPEKLKIRALLRECYSPEYMIEQVYSYLNSCFLVGESKEACSETSQASTMERFAEIVKGLNRQLFSQKAQS